MVAVRALRSGPALAGGRRGACPQVGLRLGREIQAVLLWQWGQAREHAIPPAVAREAEALAPGLRGLEPEAPVLEFEGGVEGVGGREVFLRRDHRRPEDVALRLLVVE